MDTSWETIEGDQSITVIHDNRWLAIVGIPLSLVGTAIGIGPWFIDEARNSEAWPILVVGSLIGLGFFVMGLALCFSFESVKADRLNTSLERKKGKPPFQRSTKWSLDLFKELKIDLVRMTSASRHSSSLQYRLQLAASDTSVLIASCPDYKPIQTEAQRWAKYLDLRLNDETKVN